MRSQSSSSFHFIVNPFQAVPNIILHFPPKDGFIILIHPLLDLRDIPSDTLCPELISFALVSSSAKNVARLLDARSIIGLQSQRDGRMGDTARSEEVS